MTANSYWLEDWMRQQGVDSPSAAKRLLSRRRGLDTAAELAYEALRTPIEPLESPVPIMASTSLDLSGRLGCQHHECLQDQLDGLFRRVWHYFDTIAVVGAEPNRFLDRLDQRKSAAIDYLLHQMELRQHVHDLGLHPWMAFTRRVNLCTDHIEQHAQELGLAFTFENGEEEAVSYLLQGASFEIEHLPDGSERHHFDHPDLPIPRVFRTRRGEHMEPEEAMKNAAVRVVSEFVAYLTSDVQTADALEAPVLTSAVYDLDDAPAANAGTAASSTALALQLPVLLGIPTRELVTLIADEQLAFERFRTALRAAIKEQVAKSPDTDPKQVARTIEADILQPALDDVQQRLNAAERTLSMKLGLDVVVGTAVTTIGTVLGVPLVAGTGVAAAAGGLRHISKYVEEKRDIALSDMYFLWQAERAGA